MVFLLAEQKTRTMTVLVPAHKAGYRDGAAPQIVETILSLQRQSVPPNRIIILANNGGVTDGTAELSEDAGAEVVIVPPNPDKKAGALNFWLDENLADLDDRELILVMDADSALDRDFIENALAYVAAGHYAVGGIFGGKAGGGLVGFYQRNEYSRYGLDVGRKHGRTLVLTGTATVFIARCLKDVVAARNSGALPSAVGAGHVYDTMALTEDNELTYALLHLGYRIVAPPECTLLTEVMETWRDLANQRYRWKRGAVENNQNYGITRFTAKYHLLQWWGLVGIFVTIAYLATILLAIVTTTFALHGLWIGVTLIYMAERAWTVRRRGWRAMLGAVTVVFELPFDLFLQAIQLRALFGALFHTKAVW